MAWAFAFKAPQNTSETTTATLSARICQLDHFFGFRCDLTTINLRLQQVARDSCPRVALEWSLTSKSGCLTAQQGNPNDATVADDPHAKNCAGEAIFGS